MVPSLQESGISTPTIQVNKTRRALLNNTDARSTENNAFWKGYPEIESGLDSVSRRMHEIVNSGNFPLAEAIEKLINANGKMLRPAFMLLSGRFGRQPKDLSDLAAALELLHVATLIHDDIIDEAGTRRGVPTIHSVHGVKGAVLAGDWLFSRSFRLASSSSSPANARLLAALVGALCSEEIHQDMDRYRWPRSERNYLRKISGKTAALFALSLRAGAVETKTAPRHVMALTRIGWATGMAFQIIDDVLDFESTEGVLGKPVAADMRDGLCTLPLIIALKKVPEKIEAYLGTEKISNDGIEKVLAAVNSCGALKEAREHAGIYTARAMQELGHLPKGKAKEELHDIIKQLLSRHS